MNSGWVDAMEKRLGEEEPYHKCIPKSIRARVICIADGKRGKAIRLPDVPVSEGVIPQSVMRETHNHAKQVSLKPTRLRNCMLISFPGTHEEVILGDVSDLVVTGVALGSPTSVPESLPRFHTLTSLMIVLEERQPITTRRRMRPKRVRLTRRVKSGSLKTRGVVLNT